MESAAPGSSKAFKDNLRAYVEDTLKDNHKRSRG